MERSYVDFWNPKNFPHAKSLILAGDWQSAEEYIWPILLNESVRRLLPDLKNRTALEIGCGVGRLVKPMAKEFGSVVGIDIAPNMVKLSKEYLKGVDNATTMLCDGSSIPLPNESVDFAYSVIVLQHIPYRNVIQQYLRETKRVLKLGGVARMQTHRGKPTGKWNKTMVGHFYPSILEFAMEFHFSGLHVASTELGLSHPEHLWVTATKENA